MATNTSTQLIKIAVDTADLQKSQYLLDQLNKIFKATGNSIDATAKLYNLKMTEMANGTVRLSGTVKHASGQIQDFDGKLQKFSRGAAQGLSAIPSAAKVATGSLDALGKSASGASLSMSSLLAKSLQGIFIYRVLGAAYTTLTTAISSAAKFFVDFETQLARVRIVTNDTKEETDALGASALSLAQKYGSSFSELGEALETFAQLGFSSSEILQQLGSVLAFSAISGRKAKEVTEDLIAIQSSFNLTAADTPRILDSITAVQLKYSITTSQLSAALRKFGPAAASVGLSLSESIGLITGLQEQTRKSGEEVGTALSNLTSRLQSVDIVAKLQNIAKVPLFMDKAGNATSEFTGRVRSTNEILAILATRFKDLTASEQAGLAVALGGRQRFTDASAALQNYDTVLKATIDSLNSFNSTNSAFEKLADTTANSMQRVGNAFREGLNQIRPAANGIAKSILDMAEAYIKASNAIDKFFISQQRGANDLLDKTPDQTEESVGFGSLFKNKEEQKVTESEEKRLSAISEIAGKYDEIVSLQQVFNTLQNVGTEEQKANRAEQLNDALKTQVDLLNQVAKDRGIDVNFSAKDFDELAKSLEKFGIENDAFFAYKRELANQASKAKEDAETDLELKNRLNEKEEELTALGATRLVILEEQLKIIASSDGFNGLAIKAQERKIRLERDSIANKQKIAEQELKSNIAVQQAIANGVTGLELEKLKLKYANDIAIAQQNVNEQALIELKTRQATAEAVAKSSQELQSSVKGGISNFLQSKGTLADIGTGFQETVKKGFADAIASSITKDLFKITGIGDTFGGLTVSIEENINALNANTNALLGKGDITSSVSSISSIKSGTLKGLASTIETLVASGSTNKNLSVNSIDSIKGGSLKGLASTIETLVSKGGSKDSSGLLGTFTTGFKGLFDKLGSIFTNDSNGKGGIFSGLFSSISKLFSGSGGSGGGLSSLFGGSGGGFGSALGGLGAGFGAFQSAKKGDIFGATTQGALAGAQLGGGYGAIIGGALGFFGSLFRKPKRTVDIQEQTKQFQVSSRIDITNKKLDVVNRNLVALKQTFETIILPDSAFLGTKRSLEDQFSVNSRRGVF